MVWLDFDESSLKECKVKKFSRRDVQILVQISRREHWTS
jgi:hypothetical protein